MKGYRVFNLETQDISVTTNVEFHKLLFPRTEQNTKEIDDTPPPVETKESTKLPTARKHNQPKYLQDYHCYLAKHNNAASYECTKSHPLSSIISYANLG